MNSKLDLANQISSFIRADYTVTYDTVEQRDALYNNVQSSLNSLNFSNINDESLKSYFDKNDIFYEFYASSEGLRNFTSAFIGEIVQRDISNSIYVCEKNTQSLSGVDFYEAFIGKTPTLLQRHGSRYLVNQTSIRDSFSLAVSELDTIRLFSRRYEDSPHDFPEKRKHSELFAFIDGSTDVDLLTEKYISMVLNKDSQVQPFTDYLYRYIQEI